MEDIIFKETRSRTETAWGITQTERSKLKEVNELKKQLKKMPTTDKQADKEPTTSPSEKRQEAAKLLQEVIATKEQIQQDDRNNN